MHPYVCGAQSSMFCTLISACGRFLLSQYSMDPTAANAQQELHSSCLCTGPTTL